VSSADQQAIWSARLVGHGRATTWGLAVGKIVRGRVGLGMGIAAVRPDIVRPRRYVIIVEDEPG